MANADPHKPDTVPVEDPTPMSPSASGSAGAPKILRRPTDPASTISPPTPQEHDSAFKSAAATSKEYTNEEDRMTASSPPSVEVAEAAVDAATDNGEVDPILSTAVGRMKDRLFVLKLDNQCETFIKDESQTCLEFPSMNSYQRLIIHRIAVHFNLVHVADSARKAVLLYKSDESKIPDVRLADIEVASEVPASATSMTSVKIMQRHHHHGRGSRHSSTDSGSESGAGQKTYEEREAAYQAARARIFQEDEESDASNTSRTSGHTSAGGSSGTGKATVRNGKSNPRSQPSRPRNPQGFPRPRTQYGQQQYLGELPQQYPPTGDLPNGIQYYSNDTSAGAQHPSQSFDGMYGVPPNQNYYQPGMPPPQGSYAANMPYVDWNGVPYPAQMGMPGDRGMYDQRTEQQDSYGAQRYAQHYSASEGGSVGGHRTGGPRGSAHGLNPQAQAFTSQYPSLRSDGVALHYYPNASADRQRSEADLQSPPTMPLVDPASWATVCGEHSIRTPVAPIAMHHNHGPQPPYQTQQQNNHHHHNTRQTSHRLPQHPRESISGQHPMYHPSGGGPPVSALHQQQFPADAWPGPSYQGNAGPPPTQRTSSAPPLSSSLPQRPPAARGPASRQTQQAGIGKADAVAALAAGVREMRIATSGGSVMHGRSPDETVQQG
ncbi:hypothetical protein HKX48_005237 [Thoreauomyces humboldtii]|nr:hypothetical protein HKX48_005237 [Thoreauomyces humboldtii]